MTTLKKYVRSYDVNVRPDSTASEFAIAVGRYGARFCGWAPSPHVAPRRTPLTDRPNTHLPPMRPGTAPVARHFDSYLDVEEPDVLRKFMNYVRARLCCAPPNRVLGCVTAPTPAPQVKKQAIIDPIVRRSTRKEREAKLARRKRARKNLVRVRGGACDVANNLGQCPRTAVACCMLHSSPVATCVLPGL